MDLDFLGNRVHSRPSNDRYKRAINLILLILVFGNSVLSQSKKINFSIAGFIKNYDTGVVYLSYIKGIDNFSNDSSDISNSKFYFSGLLNHPTRATLSFQENKSKIMNSVVIWIEPGNMKLRLKSGNLNKIKIFGSRSYKKYRQVATLKEKLNLVYKNQLDSLKGARNQQVINDMRERLTPYFEKQKEIEIDFVKKNLKSYVAAYLLFFLIQTNTFTLDSAKALYAGMSREVQNSFYGQIVNEEINKIDKGSPGKFANSFRRTDAKGNIVDLSALKGKYVLLEFWASWCVPCRKEHPGLIELYNLFHHSGVEFIGIADDDKSQDAWKKAIEKDKILWPQVLRGNELTNSIQKDTKIQDIEDINYLFGISSLPTLLLIDPNGYIIWRAGEGELSELNKKLKSISGKN